VSWDGRAEGCVGKFAPLFFAQGRDDLYVEDVDVLTPVTDLIIHVPPIILLFVLVLSMVTFSGIENGWKSRGYGPVPTYD
jgi:hypothetical protein